MIRTRKFSPHCTPFIKRKQIYLLPFRARFSSRVKCQVFAPTALPTASESPAGPGWGRGRPSAIGIAGAGWARPGRRRRGRRHRLDSESDALTQLLIELRQQRLQVSAMIRMYYGPVRHWMFFDVELFEGALKPSGSLQQLSPSSVESGYGPIWNLGSCYIACAGAI